MKKAILLLMPIFTFLLVISCGNLEREKKVDKDGQDVLILTEIEEEYYLNAGNEIAGVVFAALSSELMTAMSTEGVPGALSYCNIRAYPVTDSISEKFDAQISRLAEYYRNSNNRIEKGLDKKVFEDFKKMDSEALQSAERVIKINNQNAVFYKPILLQAQCMACHGPKSVIGDKNLAFIRELYPEDRAVNFNPGDLRGMWRIEVALRTDL